MSDCDEVGRMCCNGENFQTGCSFSKWPFFSFWGGLFGVGGGRSGENGGLSAIGDIFGRVKDQKNNPRCLPNLANVRCYEIFMVCVSPSFMMNFHDERRMRRLNLLGD